MRTILLFAAATVLLTSSLCVPSLVAQSSTTGALTVTVTDRSGAAIAGASLQLESEATGQKRTEVTGAQGSHTFPLLPVGAYKVTISAPGFKSAQLPSVILNVTETRSVNQVLEVGDSAQSVTVQADTQALQTESAALGTVVGSTTISALPLVTRDYTQILNLSAGTVSNVVNAAAIGHGSSVAYVNGMFGNGNSYLIDGADSTSMYGGMLQERIWGSAAIPNPDTLQEFKVQTSMYDASYGRNSGSNVNVVTKSGTNEYHGNVFAFLRNTVLNANDFFRNRNGLERAVLKQDQEGFTFGGPFIKNKLFFFISYQRTIQANGLDSQSVSSVVLPPQLTNDRTAAGLGKAFCPQNNSTGSAYANTRLGGVQVACDGSNINPVALKLLNYKAPGAPGYLIPQPQNIINAGTPGAFGSSVFSLPATYKEGQYLGNLDYVINSKNTLAGRYFYAHSPQYAPFSCSPCLPGVSGNRYDTGNNNILGRLTTVLTPSLVNEARTSSVYIKAHNWSLDPMRSADFGITPAVPTYPDMPPITISSLFGFGGAGNDGLIESSHTTQVSDQLSWIRGRHTVRTGFTAERWYLHAAVYGIARGALTFQSFPDFLLGMSAAQNGSAFSNVNTSSYQVGTPNLHMMANWSGAFVQDDFKVNSKLTLNTGLRWEYDGNVWDAQGMTFDEWWSDYKTVPIPPPGGTYVGLTMGSNYPGTLPEGVRRRPGMTSLRNGNSPYHNYMPRIGLAWQPLASNKLVLRAGYAWFFTRVTFNSPQYAACCGPPQSQTVRLSGAANSRATFQVPFGPTPARDESIPVVSPNLDSGGPVGFSPYLRTLTSTISYPFGFDPDQVPPLVINYNFNLQYAVTPSTTLEVGYVNSRGLRLAAQQLFNVPQIASPTNPVNCGLPTGCVTTTTSGNASQRVPIIGVVPGGIQAQGNYGNFQYHGLQVELRKKMANGLQYGLAYTYSKGMADVQGNNNGGDVNSNNPEFDRRQRWGPTDYNRTHRLVLNYVYQIPEVLAGKGLVGKALSGWSLAGVMTLQTGLPMTVTDATGGAAYGNVGTARAQFCPGVTHANVSTPGGVTSRLNGYLNKAAFCAQPIVGAINGVGGATGYGNSGRGIITGPGQNNFDVAIAKRMRVGGIRENSMLEFRTEFFNAFNHAQFNNPGTSFGTANFGLITSTAVAPRIIQFGLKYNF